MAIWYLSADIGDDTTGDGSEATPWLTISKAHDSAADGDTIICLDSTNTFTFTKQVFTKSLTIQGQQDDASGAILDGGGLTINSSSAYGAWYTLTESISITIEKVTFRNFKTLGGGGLGSPVFGVGATGVTFSVNNCIVHNAAIHTSYSVGGVISPHNGTGANGSTLSLNNCLGYDLKNNSSPASGWAQYNIIAGIRNASTCTINITGCTFYLFTGHAIQATANFFLPVVGTINVKNTICVDEDSTIDAGSGTFSYCDFFQVADSPTGTGVITSDPLLVDPANANFNLRPSSPCLDTGVLI